MDVRLVVAMSPRRATWLLTTSIVGAFLVAMPQGGRAADFDLQGNSRNITTTPVPGSFGGLGYLNGTDNLTSSVNIGGAIAMLTEGHNLGTAVEYDGTVSDGAGRTGIWHTSGSTLFNGTNTYSGGTNIIGGRLTATNGSAFGTDLIRAEEGGTVALQFAGGMTINNDVRIEGTGDAAAAGALFNTQGNNTIAGTVRLGANALIAGNDRLTINNVESIGGGAATLTTGGAGIISIGDIVLNGGIIVDAASTGGLDITGANSSTGGTTVKGGTLRLLNGAAIADTGAIVVESSGTLQIVNSETIGSLSGAGAVQISAGQTLTTGGDNTSTTVSGAISGATGTLEKTGTGTLTLAGANTYGGGTTLSGGRIIIGTSAALGTGALALAGGTLQTNAAMSVGNAINVTGAGSSIDTGINTLMLTGALGGTNSFSKTGTGTLVFGTTLDTSGHSNGMTLAGGTLSLQGNLAAGFGTITTTGSVIDYANGITSAAAIDINSNTTQLQVLTGTATQSGVISETGGARPLEKIGAGTLVLTGANTYSGGTTISAGALAIRNNTALGSGAAVVASGAELIFGGGISVNNNITINGTGIAGGGALRNAAGANNVLYGTVTLGSDSLITSDGNQLFLNGVTGNNTNLTIGGPGIVSAGNVALGTGSLTINSGAFGIGDTGTYTGQTTVNGGVLYLGSGSAIIDSGVVVLNSGGQLEIVNGFSETIGSLAGAGTALINAGLTLTTGGNNASTTSSGAIGGAGALAKDGTGTYTLSGANTYAGGTTISAGTLQIGDGGTTGSIAGNVVNNATLAFNRSDATGFGGVISGTGAVTKSGAGTLTLSGVNTYGGGTTISAGAVNAQQNVALGTGAVSVASGAALELQGSWTYNNALTLNGSGIANGGALRNVLNTNIYNGAITLGSASRINSDNQVLNMDSVTGTNVDLTVGGVANTRISGTLALGTGNLIKDGTGTLNLNGTSSFNELRLMSGTVNLLNGSAVANSSAVIIDTAGILRVFHSETVGSVAGTGGVAIDDGRQLTTGADNRSTTFSGVIRNWDGVSTGALAKLGTGTLTLAGINTYTGATTVNAGTLSVNGSIATSSLTTVNAGGTLSGNGTVGNIAINGGTLAPGNSIGVLNVQGNLSFTAASSYMVEVSPSNADRVNVTGTATLGGAMVSAHFAAGSYVEREYTIVNATGGVVGTFGAQVNTDLPSNFKSRLRYDANNAYLDLALSFDPPVPPPGPTPPVYVPLNANQAAVGNALVGFFNRTGGIPLMFGALDAKGLTQVSGELGTGSQQTTFDAMTQFMGVMTDPFAAGRDVASTGAVPFADETMAYAAKRRPSDALAAIYRKSPPMAPVVEERWNVWAAGFGGSRSTDGRTLTGSNNTTSSIYGTAVGADYWFSPNTVAGFAIAGGGTNFSVNGGGSGRSDLLQLGTFVRHTVGSAYVTAAAAYGWQDITTDRFVTVAGFDHLRANFNANSYSGRIEAGNRFVLPWVGGLGVTPYAAAQVTAFDLPSYAEGSVSGENRFALAYASKTVTATRTEFGLRSDKSFAVNDAILTLRGRAAWAYDYNPDRSIAATFQTLPGASFVVNGAAQSRNAALTTASAEMKWMNGWSVAGTFEGEFSDETRSYAGKGVVRYAW